MNSTPSPSSRTVFWGRSSTTRKRGTRGYCFEYIFFFRVRPPKKELSWVIHMKSRFPFFEGEGCMISLAPWPFDLFAIGFRVRRWKGFSTFKSERNINGLDSWKVLRGIDLRAIQRFRRGHPFLCPEILCLGLRFWRRQSKRNCIAQSGRKRKFR